MNTAEQRLARWAVAAIVILIVGSVVLCFIPPTEVAQHESSAVTDISVAELSAIAIKNQSGGFGLVVEPQGVSILDVADVPLSASALKVFVYQLAHLSAERVIGVPDHWKEFGLETPDTYAVLLRADGSRIRLYLGNQSPLEDGWYLRREDSDTLYLVSDQIADMMRYTVNDFRNLQLFAGVAANQFTDFSYIKIQRAGDEVVVQCDTTDETLHFTVEKPFQATLDWQTAVQTLLTPLTKVEPIRFVSDSKPLSYYGLDQPLYHMEVSYGGQTSRLVFSHADELHYYCAAENDTTVVKVEKADFAFLDVRATDLLGTSLYARTAAETENVTIVSSDKRYSVDFTGQGTALQGTCGNRLLSQQEVVKLYGQLTNIPIAEELPYGQELTAQSFVTLVFTMRDGTVDTVALVPLSERRCAVVVNGQATHTTYLASAREILNAATLFLGK